MSKFLFLYKGYMAPTPEIGQAWMNWFDVHAHRMIDSGNPMTGGVKQTILGRHARRFPAAPDLLTGYPILHARHDGRNGSDRPEQPDDHQCDRLRTGPDVGPGTADAAAVRVPPTPPQTARKSDEEGVDSVRELEVRQALERFFHPRGSDPPSQLPQPAPPTDAGQVPIEGPLR